MSLIQGTFTGQGHDVAPEPEIAIHARGLRKSFGATHALRGVDLQVSKGEMTVLLGLSGSGKSTLLRCLNGLHPLSGGEATVLGEPVHRCTGPSHAGSAPCARAWASSSSISTWSGG